MEFKQRGNAFLSEGKLNEAIDEYTSGITSITHMADNATNSPADSRYAPETKALLSLLYANRAQAFLKKDMFRAAVDDCSLALNHDPHYSKAYARRGKAYRNLEEFDKCLEDYRKASELDSVFGESLVEEIVEVQEQMGHKKQGTGNGAQRQRVPSAVAAASAGLPRSRRKKRVSRGSCKHDPPVTTRPHLMSCMEYSQEVPNREFYPASPKWWMENPTKFAELCLVEMKDYMSQLKVDPKLIPDIAAVTAADFEVQRGLDVVSMNLHRSYKDRWQEELSVAEHERIFAECGAKLIKKKLRGAQKLSCEKVYFMKPYEVMDPIPSSCRTLFVPRCDYCDVLVTCEQPPECVCGQVYCSPECHEADWSVHQEVCESVRRPHGNAFLMTSLYWRLVVDGVLPWIGGVKDYRHLWEAQAKEEYLRQGKTELDYYLDGGERDELAERISALQAPARRPGISQKEAAELQEELFMEMSAQICAYRHPHQQDTLDRLQFKLAIMSVFDNIMRQGGRSLKEIFPDFNYDSIGETFVPFIMKKQAELKQQHKKERDDPGGVPFSSARELDSEFLAAAAAAGHPSTGDGKVDMRHIFYPPGAMHKYNDKKKRR